MSNSFDSPKRRIARAREHIADIDARTTAFFDLKPYAQVNEPAEDGWIECKLKMTAELPAPITDLAHEAVEALRSALDQAVHPFANAAQVKRPDLIHFPTADTERDFDNAFNSYLKELPASVKIYLRSLNVYKDGNILLWGLNRIRRQSTHRVIVPIGQSAGGIQLANMKLSGGFKIPAPFWNTEKNELVLLRFTPGSKTQVDGITLYIHLAFGPSEGLGGCPVLDTLKAIADRVEQVVHRLEAEFKCMGAGA